MDSGAATEDAFDKLDGGATLLLLLFASGGTAADVGDGNEVATIFAGGGPTVNKLMLQCSNGAGLTKTSAMKASAVSSMRSAVSGRRGILRCIFSRCVGIHSKV